MTSYVEKPGFVMRTVEGQLFMASLDPLRELATIWNTAPGSGTNYTLPDGTKSTQNAYVDAITAGMSAGDYIRMADGRYVTVAQFQTAAKLAPVATNWNPETPAAAVAAGNGYVAVYAPAVMKSMGQTQASQMVGLNAAPAQANLEQSAQNSRTGQASWGTNVIPDTAAAITAIKAAAATSATINTAITNVASADADLTQDPNDRFTLGGAGVDGYMAYPAPDYAGFWQPPANAADNTP